jgi:hypothetical protein
MRHFSGARMQAHQPAPPPPDFLQRLNNIPSPIRLRPGDSCFFPAKRFFFSKAE